MSLPGVWIETLGNPHRYSGRQLDEAALVAWYMNRGRFVYCLPPDNGIGWGGSGWDVSDDEL